MMYLHIKMRQVSGCLSSLLPQSKTLHLRVILDMLDMLKGDPGCAHTAEEFDD